MTPKDKQREKLGIYNLEQLARIVEKEREEKKANPCWGYWTYHPGNNTLEITKDGHFLYEIDLDKVTNSAECLDWIFQVSSKTWMSPEDRSDLLEAFKFLLNPQRYLCGEGTDRQQKPGWNQKVGGFLE